MSTNNDTGNLVLDRKPGTSIRIGDDILVTYLGNESGKGARIRVSAPRSIQISRVTEKDGILLRS